MNCRDFLAEFEERRDTLSQTAQLHLNDCPDCEKTRGEQTRVWQMIDGLRQVDAPNDFDFRVKARIAQSKSADFQSGFFPALRYVLPLALVVLILGLAAFNTTYFSGGNSPQIVETVQPMPNEKEISPIDSFSANQVAATDTNDETTVPKVANVSVEPAASNQEKQVATVEPPAKSRLNAPRKNSGDDGITSRDLSVKPPSSPKFPLGINPDQTVRNSPNADTPNLITDVQILNFIGIETVSESGGKKVKAVKPDSLADRSGVKIGDIIEAIDGKRIGGEPVRMGTFESRKLTVSRGAKKIEILLQNESK